MQALSRPPHRKYFRCGINPTDWLFFMPRFLVRYYLSAIKESIESKAHTGSQPDKVSTLIVSALLLREKDR